MRLKLAHSIDHLTCLAGGVIKRPAVLGLCLVLLWSMDSKSQQPSTWSGVDLWRKWPSNLGGATDPDLLGVWAPSTPIDLPNHELPRLYGVHASLLYNGDDARLLIFRNDAILFDLATTDQKWVLNLSGTGEPVPTPNGHEPFCSGYVPLADGRLFILGTSYWRFWLDPPGPTEGITMLDGKVSIFDPANPSEDLADIDQYWIPTDEIPDAGGQYLSGNLNPSNCGQNSCWGGQNPLSKARYYPTCLTLEDGRILVASGDFWVDCNCNQFQEEDPFEVDQQNKWLIYDPSAPAGSRWTWDDNPLTDLAGHSGQGSFRNPWVAQSPLPANPFQVSYPRMKLLPFGLFYAGNDEAVNSTPRPSFLWTPLSDWDAPGAGFISDPKVENRFTGGCVVLSLDATSTDISVLLVGGGADSEQPNNLPKLGTGAEIITYRRDASGQVTSVSPGWASTGAMNSAKGRTDGNTVLLPDGTVIAIGGEEGAHPEDQNRSCEIFHPNVSNPPAGTWSLAAEMAADRGHHSVAVLLPDGRVFSTGHENHHDGEASFGTNYQVYYPPYLFNGPNSFAARDTIETAPAVVRYGLPFEITLQDDDAADIDEVCLLAPCSPTHGTDFSQRRVVLRGVASPDDAGRLIVAGVKDSTYAPPGYYMLMVLDDGVPSEAKWVKVERQMNSDYTIAPGQTRYWGGDVWLDRDFEVQAGGTLKIIAGTTVHAKANTDRNNIAGGTAGKTEIVHRGTTKAIGGPSVQIKFTSYDGTGAAGEWVGNRFILEGCERSGYGFLGAKADPSVLEHSVVENAEYGVKIEQFVAPSLKSVTFANNLNDRDIYLDRTDVFIPKGYWKSGQCNVETTQLPFVHTTEEWQLTPGTDVVASNTCLQDAGWFGAATKVDLVGDGKVIALGAASDSIRFRPESPTNSTGDDWAGVTIDYWGRGSQFEFCSLGHAPIPLTLLYPGNSTLVKNSRIHHFSDTGMWVYSTGAGGTSVESNTIERGVGLAVTLGLTAIRCDKADNFRLRFNKFDLTGLNFATLTSPAVDIYFGQSFCGYTYSDSDSLVVDSNWILGPSQSEGGNHSGIKTNWVCGASNRKIYFANNYITGFKGDGLEIRQSSDVQFTCNTIFGNTRAVNHFRDFNVPSSSNATRFSKNWLEVKEGTEEVAQTDDNLKLVLGNQNNSNTGKNGLIVELEDVDFIQENDPDANDIIKTEVNWWYLFNSVSQVESQILAGDEASIESRVLPSAASIDYAPFKNSPPPQSPLEYCRLSSPPTGGGALGGTLQAGLVPPDEGDSRETGDFENVNSETPLVSFLQVPTFVPSQKVVTLEFGVASVDEGPLKLEIFNVLGRRLVTLENGPMSAGKHKASWSRMDDSGLAVASGVYFVRLTLPTRAYTQKLVVLE